MRVRPAAPYIGGLKHDIRIVRIGPMRIRAMLSEGLEAPCQKYFVRLPTRVPDERMVFFNSTTTHRLIKLWLFNKICGDHRVSDNFCRSGSFALSRPPREPIRPGFRPRDS